MINLTFDGDFDGNDVMTVVATLEALNARAHNTLDNNCRIISTAA